jgi:hypothetical protein
MEELVFSRFGARKRIGFPTAEIFFGRREPNQKNIGII